MANELVEKFCTSAKDGNIGVVRDIVLSGKVDVNAYSEYGWTALKHAANTNNTAMVSFLLENGANPNLPDLKSGRWMPLHNAAKKNNREMIGLLLQRGADPNVLNDENLLPVEKADAATAKWMREYVQELSSAVKKDPWKKLDDETISRTQIFGGIGQKRTEVFDFRNRHWTMTVHNTNTGHQSTVLRLFDEMKDRSMLEEAHAKLKELGGTAESGVIYAQRRIKKDFPKAG